MAADSSHPVYDDLVDAWQLVRDCIGGSRKIKAAGEDYLPRLYKQDDADYDDYKTRATFFNALKRTLQAFVGFIFRNNPEVILEPATAASLMAAFMKDSTMTGKSFYDVARDTVRDTLSLGKRGTLIDWQLIPENRPFLITYEPEDILNWKFKRIQGQTILGLIVFREMSSEWISLKAGEPEPDPWEHVQYEQLREYEVLEDGDGRPYVQVTVKRKKFGEEGTGNKKKANPIPAEWVVVDQKIPVRRGKPLTRIPFVAHGAESNDLDADEVPLEPIAEINVAHYRNSADFENALHVCGHPTPIACGFGGNEEDAEEEFYLGGKAWVTDKVDAKADFLSYDASMAAPLVTAMQEKEKQMAALGARMLEKQGESGGGRQEAFQTVQARQSGDHSALMAATIAGSQSLSDVLQWVYWWIDPSVEQPEDLDENIKIELNTKFVQMLMESTMLSALWNVYMAGGMSYETLFRNLQDGGIISSERKMADEIADIQNDPVRLAELDRQAKAEEAAVAAAAAAAAAAKKPPGEGGGGEES